MKSEILCKTSFDGSKSNEDFAISSELDMQMRLISLLNNITLMIELLRAKISSPRRDQIS